MKAYFLNLTNGIEYLPKLNGNEFSFIRIQSTACEQKRWDFILQDLDSDFLMKLALGYECVIVDFSSKKNVPRSIYQGVSFIEYVLNRIFFDKMTIPVVHGHNVKDYFDKVFNSLDNRTKKKLEYFKRFLITNNINLSSICGKTLYDGKDDYYKSILTEVYV